MASKASSRTPRDKADVPPAMPDIVRRCSEMAEGSPLPMAGAEGPGHRVCYVNPAFCRWIGLAQDALLGRPFAQVLPPGEGFRATLDRVYRTGAAETSTDQGNA